MALSQRLAYLNERIKQAARRAGRVGADITLIGVSKTVGREEIAAAYQLGLTDFGENRIADMEEKFNPLPYPPAKARLHLIGHLQTNKVKRALALADVIHSVDSLKLAQLINRHAQESGKIIPVLLE